MHEGERETTRSAGSGTLLALTDTRRSND